MSIRKEKEFECNGKTMKAFELTALQIDEWRRGLSADQVAEPHVADLLMNRTVPVSAVRLSVPELVDEDLQGAPSELAKIYDAVEEVNPFFLTMTRNMADLGEALMAMDET